MDLVSHLRLTRPNHRTVWSLMNLPWCSMRLPYDPSNRLAPDLKKNPSIVLHCTRAFRGAPCHFGPATSKTCCQMLPAPGWPGLAASRGGEVWTCGRLWVRPARALARGSMSYMCLNMWHGSPQPMGQLINCSQPIKWGPSDSEGVVVWKMVSWQSTQKKQKFHDGWQHSWFPRFKEKWILNEHPSGPISDTASLFDRSSIIFWSCTVYNLNMRKVVGTATIQSHKSWTPATVELGSLRSSFGRRSRLWLSSRHKQ